MKFLLPFYLAIFMVSLLDAQDVPSKNKLSPCGTVAEKSEWLGNFQKRVPSQKKIVPDSQILYVPLSVHLVSRDDGFGGFAEADALKALCTLNEDFEPSNIQFYLEGGFQYLPDSELFSHQTVTDGGLKMLEYNIDNSFNCYLVSSAAGNCGYNLPYAGVANAFACLGPDDHTWAHEMGHGFTLPHPFLGWEGGVSVNNMVPHNYGNPAPDSVFYDYSDFQDTLYLGAERIITGTQVEKLDGSNCLDAADGFCDTAPDYLSGRWACNDDLISPTVQTDPNGQKFQSDASLIMSYALDNCSSRFSGDQIEAMRANIAEEFPMWLSTVPPTAPITDEFVYTGPIGGELVQFDDVTLAWESLGTDVMYKVEMSLFSDFSFTNYKDIVGENAITLNTLQNNKNYYWRVLAFNSNSFCVEVSPTQTFETGDLVAVHDLAHLGELQVYPNPLQQGSKIRVSWTTPLDTPLDVKIMDIHGREIVTQQRNLGIGSTHLALELDEPAGIYILSLISEDGGMHSVKLVVE